MSRDLDEVDENIIDAILGKPLEVAGPSDIAKEIDKSKEFVHYRLNRMMDKGHIQKPQTGLYKVVNNPFDNEG